MAHICFLRRDAEGEVQEEGRVTLKEDKEFTLGRDPDKVDVVVDDPKASSLHCKIRFDGVNYWVIDLASRNGIRVNNKRVESSPLLDGYVIRIGRTHIQFRSSDKRQRRSDELGLDDEEDPGRMAP